MAQEKMEIYESDALMIWSLVVIAASVANASKTHTMDAFLERLVAAWPKWDMRGHVGWDSEPVTISREVIGDGR